MSVSATLRSICRSISVGKYALDHELTLSTVMVDAIQAWLDAREG